MMPRHMSLIFRKFPHNRLRLNPQLCIQPGLEVPQLGEKPRLTHTRIARMVARHRRRMIANFLRRHGGSPDSSLGM